MNRTNDYTVTVSRPGQDRIQVVVSASQLLLPIDQSIAFAKAAAGCLTEDIGPQGEGTRVNASRVGRQIAALQKIAVELEQMNL